LQAGTGLTLTDAGAGGGISFAANLATPDQQDAYCVARWLSGTDERGFLARYFDPSLTDEERRVADFEGWILGVC